MSALEFNPAAPQDFKDFAKDIMNTKYVQALSRLNEIVHLLLNPVDDTLPNIKKKESHELGSKRIKSVERKKINTDSSFRTNNLLIDNIMLV